MPSQSSSADDFRVVDLFSPSESSAAPASERAARSSCALRMSGDLPESFLFANPFFAPDAKSRRQE